MFLENRSGTGQHACRDIVTEALRARYLNTSYSRKEDIKIRHDVIAQQFLHRFSPDIMITRELYDANVNFADGLNWMHGNFELPDWEGRRLREFINRFSDTASPDAQNVLQFSAWINSPIDVRAVNVTLAQLLAASPLVDNAWRVPPGFNLRFYR